MFGFRGASGRVLEGRVWLRGASCRGVVGRCNKQMGWAGLEVRLAGVWLGGAISKWDGQMFKILLRLAGVWLGGAISKWDGQLPHKSRKEGGLSKLRCSARNSTLCRNPVI